MMLATYYALRHKPTGVFMPLLPIGRGYSHWEPTDPDGGLQIRLFKSRAGALNALRQWARGVHQVSFPDSSDPTNWFPTEPEYSISVIPQDRCKDDFEVVAMDITERAD